MVLGGSVAGCRCIYFNHKLIDASNARGSADEVRRSRAAETADSVSKYAPELAALHGIVCNNIFSDSAVTRVDGRTGNTLGFK
jgi:hypothetical protein